MATLERQKASLSEEGRSLANRPPPCAFGTLNKFAATRSCTICTLMQSRGEYKGHSYAHFLSRKAEQVRAGVRTGQHSHRSSDFPDTCARVCECHGARVEIRNNSWELVLGMDGSQLASLTGKDLYRLSHLFDPPHLIFRLQFKCHPPPLLQSSGTQRQELSCSQLQRTGN